MVDMLLPFLVRVPKGFAALTLVQGMPDIGASIADDPVEGVGVETSFLQYGGGNASNFSARLYLETRTSKIAVILLAGSSSIPVEDWSSRGE